MKADEAVVYIVDDDDEVRTAMEWLLKSVGLPVRSFASATVFLDGYNPAGPGCLILDVRMPGIGGLDLQKYLAARKCGLPIIFLTAHADVPMATRAMAAGAFHFIEKPCNNQLLIDTVQRALAKSVEETGRTRRHQWVRDRVASLTDREREVLRLLIEGASNKGVARALGISERTTEVHRAHVMKKIDVHSIAELVRVVIEAGIEL